MQDLLAKADKMILNKSSLQLDDHDKALLCKGLSFAPTPNWSKSVENAKWINAWQHVRRTEWNAVLGEKDDSDFVLPKKLSMPKASRPDSAKIDQETKTYVEMVFSKLRNIKPLLLEAYRTNNNLSHEERKSLSKLPKLTEERKIVIYPADKDCKIVILNYADYDAIMTRELQQFEKSDVSVEGCDAYLEKLRKDCNDLMVKLHNLVAVNDELLDGQSFFVAIHPPTPARFSKQVS